MIQHFPFFAFKSTLIAKFIKLDTNPDFGLFKIIQEIAFLSDIDEKANLFLFIPKNRNRNFYAVNGTLDLKLISEKS